MPQIRAVLLDLDETLLHDEASTDAALAATVADCCAQRRIAPGRLAAELRAAAAPLWAAGPEPAYCRALGISALEGMWATFAVGDDAPTAQLREFAPRYRRAAWARALAAAGAPADADLVAELAERYVWERARRQVLFPEALPVLVQLRAAGVWLCLLTNGDRDLQRRKAVGAGLPPLLDGLVISGELGIGKPDPAIFRHALSLGGFSPDAAVMVGDSATRDVAGAAAAGLRAVWLDRFGEGRQPEGSWRILPDLVGLPALLGEA